MKKYAKKDRIPKKEIVKIAKCYRNMIADINDLAYNLSQAFKFGEKYAEKQQMVDSINECAEIMGETGFYYEPEDIVAIAKLSYSAIDGFMSVVGNCTDLTKVTKKTPVYDVARIASDMTEDNEGREELVMAVKEWANKWYAQNKDYLEVL